MNKELLASMREQMRPSEEARAALEEKLAAWSWSPLPASAFPVAVFSAGQQPSSSAST